MDGSLLVTNIQRMCVNDGPGIRTTVFMKGCNLHCPWCANPENIHPYLEWYYKENRQGKYGKYYTAEQLFHQIMKDRRYWEPDGGVTFSGGEPLLWMEQLSEVMEKLRAEDVHIAVETALQMDKALLDTAMRYVAFFIVDVKILQANICRDILGGNEKVYKENLELLKTSGKEMIFRIPCNREYTVHRENLELIKELLAKYKDIPVEIFATHTLGREKYESLGLECREFAEIPAQELEKIAQYLSKSGSRVTINTI